MKVMITGSSGFVGTGLIDSMLGAGHEVIAVDAAASPRSTRSDAFSFILADTTKPGIWQDTVQVADMVINLAGKNIFHRWTGRYKQEIYDSRILTTRNIVDALPKDRSQTLISTSAAGYYGSRGDEALIENKGPGNDFLARVCVDWENEAFLARDKGARVVCARFGVVLGKDGGALSKMIPAYRLYAGGPLGDGMQWFPWIHIDDLIGAIHFVADNEELEGPVNFCSPNPVRNNEFAKTLGKVLNRPALIRTPAFMLRLAAGELGDLVLNSQRALGTRLVSSGFTFKYPHLYDALRVSVG